MSHWRCPCVVCRRPRPAVFVQRLAPFGVLAFCEGCRRAVLQALLEACDPHSLAELMALLRAEDAERRPAVLEER